MLGHGLIRSANDSDWRLATRFDQGFDWRDSLGKSTESSTAELPVQMFGLIMVNSMCTSKMLVITVSKIAHDFPASLAEQVQCFVEGNSTDSLKGTATVTCSERFCVTDLDLRFCK